MLKYCLVSIFLILNLFSLSYGETPKDSLVARSTDGNVVVRLLDQPCTKTITDQLKKEYQARFKKSILLIKGEEKVETCWTLMEPMVIIVSPNQEQVAIPMGAFSPSEDI